MKVGSDDAQNIRRAAIMREAIGDDCYLMFDANQVWEVSEAIEWIKKLEFSNPFFIEEPTSPDDILGFIKIKKDS